MSRPRGSGRCSESFLRLGAKEATPVSRPPSSRWIVPWCFPPSADCFPICVVFFFPDPHPRRFLPAPRTPVASPPPPQAPPKERRGSDPRGPAPPGPAEGRQTSGRLSAAKQTSTDSPSSLLLVGKGASRGAHRLPSFTPSSQRRKSQDSGSSSGGLAGISALDLGLIITARLLLLLLLLLFFFTQGRKTKRAKKAKKTLGFI